MNILFHIDVECVPENGGIERVTSLLTKELRKRGHKVYSSYTIPVEREAPRPDFDGVYLLTRNDSTTLTNIISENEIDVIVIQKVFRDLPWFKKAITKSGRNTKMVYTMHTRPNRTSGMNAFRHLVFNDRSKFAWTKIPLKILLLPQRIKQYMHRQYNWPAQYAEATVLLSSQYKDIWQQFSNNRAERIFSIPNPLTFESYATEETVSHKSKKVLIVARFSEKEKNLVEAMRIWKGIEANPVLDEWTLDIVGDGPDRGIVEGEARRLGLKRVTFWGYRSPLPFYEQSSLYMMTSHYEGWPMTLNESGQNGCVPIVYDSFKSVHDILSNGENGYIVPNRNREEFVRCMETLMTDDSLRTTMAVKGIEASRRFGVSEITDKWEQVFNELIAAKDE